MIRPFTCLCLAAALGSGLYLYSEKHRTALLDREISHVMHDAQAARDRTGLLRAEWALLNEPGRLQGLADKYLKLKAMAPTQFVQLADLSSRLPAPSAALPEGTTDDDATAAADAAAPADTPAPSAQIAAKPESAGSTQTPTANLAAKLAHAETHAKPARHVTVADRQDPSSRDGLLTHGSPLPLAAAQPVGARMFSAMARPMRPVPRPQVVAAAPSYAAASPFIGSALGGTVSLPPPVPYAAGAR